MFLSKDIWVWYHAESFFIIEILNKDIFSKKFIIFKINHFLNLYQILELNLNIP
jgi:hypothetical protein